MDDQHLVEHAAKYGMTLPQFRAMCEGASEMYEGKGLSAVDGAFAKEAFHLGFIHAINFANKKYGVADA